MEYVNIAQIKLLYEVNTLLGTTPRYRFNQKYNKAQRQLDVYVLLVIVIIVTCSSLSLKGRITNTYPFTPNATDILLDFLSYTSLSFSNATICITIRLLQPHKMINLLNGFAEIDSKLRFTNKNLKLRFNIEVFCYFVLYWTYGLYTFSFWQIAVGVAGNWPYYFVIIQKFQLITLSLLIHNIALAFYVRFKYLNSKIMMCGRPESRSAVNIHMLQQLHKKMLLMFRTFNQIFGKALVCLCLNFVLGCLHPINSMILQVIKGNVLSGEGLQVANFPLNYVCITVLMTCNTMVFCIPNAKSCNNATNEALKTHDVVQHVLVKLEKDKNETNLMLNSLKQHLRVIQSEATCEYPHFTADDFYIVDHSLLLGLLGVITSYLIILIQVDLL